MADFITHPPLWFVHALLTVIQTLVGFGSVLQKIAFPASVNPVVFVLYRNLMAFPLTMAMTLKLESKSSDQEEAELLVQHFSIPFPIRLEHWPLLFLASLGMCMSNTLYTIGLKLGDPVLGSAWQASIPLWVMGYAAMLGWEKPTKLKLLGFLLAIGGACVVLFVEGDWASEGFVNNTSLRTDSNNSSSSSSDSSDSSGTSDATIANILFLLNVNGLSLYFLVCRYMTVTHGYSALGVSSWAFLINAGMIFLLVFFVAAVHPLHKLMMPDADSDGFVIEWTMPMKTFWVLIYIVCVFSILSFAVSNWCQQFVEPAKVQIYQTIQPVSAALLAWLLVSVDPSEHDTGGSDGLEAPGPNILGSVGIIVGMGVVLWDEVRLARQRGATRGLFERTESFGLHASSRASSRAQSCAQSNVALPARLDAGSLNPVAAGVLGERSTQASRSTPLLTPASSSSSACTVVL